MHDHDSSLLKLQIRGTWIYRMTTVVLIFEIEPVPKIFESHHCIYTKPVIDIIHRHGLSHHSYADDTQLYMTMDNSNNNWRDGMARIQLGVSEIRGWINQNMLKLNDD